MSTISTIKDYIPPILIRILKSILKHHKTYESYREALRDSSSGLGYEDPYLIKTVYEETREYISLLNNDLTIQADQTLVQSMIPFAFIQKKEVINVIDIGGACGYHYFTLKKALGPEFKFHWNIVETKALAEISKPIENDELKFFDNIKDASDNLGELDLIFSSGTIQYFEDPRKALFDIVNTGARYVLLSRLSLTTSGRDIITVQKSLLSQNSLEKLPAGFKDRIIKYPHTNLNEEDFKKIIQTNYRIKLHFEDNSGIIDVNDSKCIGYGVLLERIYNKK